MTSYAEIDWTQTKPSRSELSDEWAKVRIEDAGSSDPRLSEVVATLAKTHVNGGAMLGRFSIDAPPSWRWQIARNRFQEASFFSKFYEHPKVRAVLRGLGALKECKGDLGFQLDHPFGSVARVADILAAGGAYERFEGSDRELLELCQSLAEAAFDGRYADVWAHISYEPWCNWFNDIAWDTTFFWFDRRTGIATTLLITDTD